MLFDETIAAIATPPGTGAIGIVRLSGPEALSVADRVFAPSGGTLPSAMRGYTARHGHVVDGAGAVLDEAVLLVYRAPKSYTGEDAAELMCHGGEVACAAVLRAVLDAGAVAAGPGEFTRRALLNGRMTLTEAEAVAALIGAASLQGERAAAALMDGALYRRTVEMRDALLAAQAHIAASVDFPEEDVQEIDAGALLAQLRKVAGELAALVGGYETGAAVLRGIPAVIAGSPNVGKSTLLNLLAGAPRAIVTPVAGTTRDIVETQVRLGGTALLLADTAGIREGGDEVEAIGIQRALQRLDEAALVIAVFDGSRPLSDDDRQVIERTRNRRVLAVVNKTDLAQRVEMAELEQAYGHLVTISANDGAALTVLDRAVARIAGLEGFDPSQPVLATERQRRCALAAREAVELAAEAAQTATLDVVYALLDEALAALGELSGENMTEALLDEVFSRFCVGK